MAGGTDAQRVGTMIRNGFLLIYTLIPFIGLLAMALTIPTLVHGDDAILRGVGDMGLVIERASGRIQVVETTGNTILSQVGGLGDLSHASAVYSRDARYAFLFGRDGGLSKVDLLTGRLVRRVVQAGNAIGGAISAPG